MVIHANNLGLDRSTFPGDAALEALRASLYENYGEAKLHESVIQHSLLASSVICARSKDVESNSYIAYIATGFTIFPSGSRLDMTGFCRATFEGTRKYIERILNHIPGGFRVEGVFMDTVLLSEWITAVYDLSSNAHNTGAMDESLKSMPNGQWMIKYTWANPFELDTNMIAVDVVNNHLKELLNHTHFDGCDYSRGFTTETNEEYLSELVYQDKIRIQQHPHSKSSFLITASKMFLPVSTPTIFMNIDVYKEAVRACDYKLYPSESPFDLLAINTHNLDGYLGAWWAFKKKKIVQEI